MKNKQEVLDLLNEVDFILTMFEDWMHGIDGKDVTEARSNIIKIIKLIDNAES